MGAPETVLRGLVRISRGPERVHGVPKLEILSFLVEIYHNSLIFATLWCVLHVFQGLL